MQNDSDGWRSQGSSEDDKEGHEEEENHDGRTVQENIKMRRLNQPWRQRCERQSERKTSSK